jgi:hypothetical protein
MVGHAQVCVMDSLKNKYYYRLWAGEVIPWGRDYEYASDSKKGWYHYMDVDLNTFINIHRQWLADKLWDTQKEKNNFTTLDIE